MAVGVTVPDEEVHPDSKGMSICVTCPGVTEKVVKNDELGFVAVTVQARGADAKACRVTLYCGA